MRGLEEKVSVIIPLFNKEVYIGRAIRSVLNQTFTDWNLYVINDGSTDSSLEKANEFDDPRIFVFSQKNAGVSAARNYGIEKAGEGLVVFLDADDFWDRNMLGEICSLRRNFPEAGLVATGFRRVNGQGDGWSVSISPSGNVEQKMIHDYFLRCKVCNFIHTSSVAIPFVVLDDIGGFPVGEKFGEDVAVWTRIALEYPLACSARVCGNFVRERSENAPRHCEEIPLPPSIPILISALRGEIPTQVSPKIIKRAIRGHVLQVFSYHRRKRKGGLVNSWIKKTKVESITPVIGGLGKTTWGRSLLYAEEFLKRFFLPFRYLRFFKKVTARGLVFERVKAVQLNRQ